VEESESVSAATSCSLCFHLSLSAARAYDPTLIRCHTVIHMAQTLQYSPYS